MRGGGYSLRPPNSALGGQSSPIGSGSCLSAVCEDLRQVGESQKVLEA